MKSSSVKTLGGCVVFLRVELRLSLGKKAEGNDPRLLPHSVSWKPKDIWG